MLVSQGCPREFWSRRVRSNRLRGRRAVASVVRCRERANNRVVASSIARNRLRRLFDRHLAAVVCGRSVVKDQVVRALRSVIGRNRNAQSSRVLHCDGLRGRRAVASVVRRSERANNRVVANPMASPPGSVACNRLARHFELSILSVAEASSIGSSSRQNTQSCNRQGCS